MVGKQREGTFTDAEYALRLYIDDLETTSTALKDRIMAQSFAKSVMEDAELIEQVLKDEQQAATDREFATSIDNQNGNTASRSRSNLPATAIKDPWQDSEILEKAAAIYMHTADMNCIVKPALTADDESDGETIAESSAWAASRPRNTKPKTGHCIACGDDKDFFHVARVPCKNKHEYCRECLAELFRLSLTDESLFPPRCDGAEIPLNYVRIFLPPDLAKNFEVKYPELCTANRVYCHDPSCAAWIPKSLINDDRNISTCPTCDKTTCAMCKAPSHSGDCPEDEALQQLINIANAEEWQRCSECKRFVELDTGCNHISCRCGFQFCYVCGARWKTCDCPQAHEARLYARARQIVARDPTPNRRLYEPARVAHAQPITRHTSTTSSPGDDTAGVGVHTADTAPGAPAPTPSPNSPEIEETHQHTSDAEQPEPIQPASPIFIATPTADLTTTHTLSHIHRRLREPLQQHDGLRQSLIEEVFAHLQAHHDCDHDRWRWVEGRHQCEECLFTLPRYIFECRQCHLRACNRCRRNRL
ncbi:hypothetical protein D0862_02334 [Hortaea werneckii]|uniref:RBR-type E3 ubiquitin transferase n=1 Tax=Hortaea werneckii TaxID=91943 RepID=A0A3M7HJF6_HORWE|nr:hypothetical protein D0862_02334 [Hortaea werneckii]